ncbi:DUF2254 family protein [Nocardia sp. NPDC052278]|uniref:DUF2254 family protein n=1 Tax=unclassified Nocardia TaxID=2637762 RepID=UPI00367ABF84
MFAAVALFSLTYALDRAVYRGTFTIPSWIIGGTPDADRQILTRHRRGDHHRRRCGLLDHDRRPDPASTQYGPRMLRNFIRDRGTQLTLGTFVASFVYAIAALVSIGPRSSGNGRYSYTSTREPMITVRSPGRPKYSAASAVM